MVRIEEYVLFLVLVLDSSNLGKASCKEIKELFHLTENYKPSLAVSKIHLTLYLLFCCH